jgi:hypothetical protein
LLTSFSLQVGGVQFRPPGCNNKTYGMMRRHHEQASKSKAMQRGSTLEAFGYGKMFSIGSRQPQGGAKADTYREYPELRAETIEDIKILFYYAYVSIDWPT